MNIIRNENKLIKIKIWEEKIMTKKNKEQVDQILETILNTAKEIKRIKCDDIKKQN